MESRSIEEVPDLVVGWKAVGGQVGRTAHYLIQAHAQGRLSVEPMRIGAQVAYTRDMLKALRSALETRAAGHRSRTSSTVAA